MNDIKPLVLTRAGLFNKLLPCIKDDNNLGQPLHCETLPMGIPPIIPSIKEKLHDILRDAQKNITYNIEPEKKIIPFDLDHRLLFNFNIPQFQTEIRERFDLKTGDVIGYDEIFNNENDDIAIFKDILKNIPADIDDAQDLFDYCFPNNKNPTSGKWIPDIEKLKNDAKTQAKEMVEKMETLDLEENATEVKVVDPKLKEILSLTAKKNVILRDVPADSSRDKATTTKGEATGKARTAGDRSKAKGDPEEATSSAASVYKWARNVDISEDIPDFKLKLPNLGHDWPFELDPFQKHAILHISKGNTVLVAAHTSAGKTVVAEYAIALSKRNKTRVVYTSPIKALSNQKFRDFKNTFGEDIGLITGDVYIKSNAFCLIMTTEILKVMLYTQDDLISELEWVIFDEVHYINDDERGVVWEEVFILLPPHVKMIFLSATAPNALQFADWIGTIKSRPIYVIYTAKRPVPLEHYLYVTNVMSSSSPQAAYGTTREPLLIMDAQNNFLQGNLEKAKSDLETIQANTFDNRNRFGGGGNRGFRGRGGATTNNYTPRGRGGSAGGGGPSGSGGAYRGGSNTQIVVIKDKKIWVDLINHLAGQNRIPAVVFVFSRKRIDHVVGTLDNVDLTVKNEKSKIHTFVKKCINKLNPVDKELPQVIYMQRLLIRGIGVHHSGILPLLKEMVEFLFHLSLIKILFATETFAMGLNMPAKTVLFESLRKFDGQGFRNMLPAEYIQMAGRAGRRGMDSTGSVFILCKDVILDEIELKMIMLGQPAKLESKFYLNYGMIMHLLQNKNMRAEDMMKRSFAEFYNQANAGDKLQELAEVTERVAKEEKLACPTCLIDVHDLYTTFKDYLICQKSLMNKLYFNKHLGKLLSPGRVIIFKRVEEDTGLGNGVAGTATTGPSGGSTNSAAKIASPKALPFTLCLGFVLKINQQGVKPCVNLLYVSPVNKTDVVGMDPGKPYSLLNMLIRPKRFLAEYIGSDSENSVPENYAKSARFGITMAKLEDVLYLTCLVGKLNPDKILEDARFLKQRDGRTQKGACTPPGGNSKSGRHNFFHFVPGLLAHVRKQTASGLASPFNHSHPLGLQLAANVNSNSRSENDCASFFFFGQEVAKTLPDAELCEHLKLMRSQISILSGFKCLKCPTFNVDHFVRYYGQSEADELMASLKHFTTEETLQHLPEYNQRIDVLKKMEYIDENLVSLMKGRVACCITNAEIVITELLFWNYFESLTPEEIVGVLSCLVCQEKHIESQSLTPELHKHKSDFLKIVSKIAQVEMECGLPSQNYLESFNFGLMEVVYQWAKGKSFKDLTGLTNAQEGAIVRCIQRLEEICHNVRSAARIIGETNLYKKMEEASFKIKRDIVFAASLYTTD